MKMKPKQNSTTARKVRSINRSVSQRNSRSISKTKRHSVSIRHRLVKALKKNGSKLKKKSIKRSKSISKPKVRTNYSHDDYEDSDVEEELTYKKPIVRFRKIEITPETNRDASPGMKLCMDSEDQRTESVHLQSKCLTIIFTII